MARSIESIRRAKLNYLARHPDRRKASVAAYYERNKERIALYHRARYQAKKSELYAQHQEWRRKNPEKAVAEVLRWQKRNPDKVREYRTKNRAKRRNAQGAVSNGYIGFLLRQQDWKCVYCRTHLAEYHVDHIIPVAAGGKTEDENLQLLCPPCNRSKGSKMPSVFAMERAAA